jgi:hypothetical protein
MFTYNTTVVILQSGEPNDELMMVLKDPHYLNRVQYVKGCALTTRSLDKVHMKTASACFLFSSKFLYNGALEEDAATVMRALVPNLTLR